MRHRTLNGSYTFNHLPVVTHYPGIYLLKNQLELVEFEKLVATERSAPAAPNIPEYAACISQNKPITYCY